MARGGPRPGSGPMKQEKPKPKLSKHYGRDALANAKAKVAALDAAEQAKRVSPLELPEGWQTPLDFMIAVMNDCGQSMSMRARMAQAAAPFVHPRAGEVQLGRKEKDAAAALSAEIGTEWEQLLN